MKFSKLFISILFISILFLTLISTLALAEVTNYLILEDIGPYKLFTGIPGRVFSGPPSKYSETNTGGILGAAGHFSEGDVSYEASYTESGGKWPFIKVEVTQHAGADSDRWLLHEVEDAYRRNPEQDYFKGIIREINGNKIFSYLLGTHYSWLSGNIVVDIKYTDLQKVKPEPLEVIQTYLQKIPSTITLTDTEAKTRPHNEQWIKDEMDRRLWLCEKWVLQIGKADLYKTLSTIVDHMVVFLDYREKYYGIQGKDDKLALIGYLSAKNEAGIKSKLTEYKMWWNVNKSKSISLP